MASDWLSIPVCVKTMNLEVEIGGDMDSVGTVVGKRGVK